MVHRLLGIPDPAGEPSSLRCASNVPCSAQTSVFLSSSCLKFLASSRLILEGKDAFLVRVPPYSLWKLSLTLPCAQEMKGLQIPGIECCLGSVLGHQYNCTECFCEQSLWAWRVTSRSTESDLKSKRKNDPRRGDGTDKGRAGTLLSS